MKRIFAIMAAVALCFALTVHAFAVEHNGNELPDIESVWTDKELYPAAFCVYQPQNGSYKLVLCSEVGIATKNSVQYVGPFVTYYVGIDSSWRHLSEGGEGVKRAENQVNFLWSSQPLLNNKGDVVFQNPPAFVLESAIPAESLTGSLDWVLAALPIILPVVAGLFGVRKGIAFLISRIRGV